MSLRLMMITSLGLASNGLRLLYGKTPSVIRWINLVLRCLSIWKYHLRDSTKGFNIMQECINISYLMSTNISFASEDRPELTSGQERTQQRRKVGPEYFTRLIFSTSRSKQNISPRVFLHKTKLRWLHYDDETQYSQVNLRLPILESVQYTGCKQ